MIAGFLTYEQTVPSGVRSTSPSSSSVSSLCLSSVTSPGSSSTAMSSSWRQNFLGEIHNVLMIFDAMIKQGHFPLYSLFYQVWLILPPSLLVPLSSQLQPPRPRHQLLHQLHHLRCSWEEVQEDHLPYHQESVLVMICTIICFLHMFSCPVLCYQSGVSGAILAQKRSLPPSALQIWNIAQ